MGVRAERPSAILLMMVLYRVASSAESRVSSDMISVMICWRILSMAPDSKVLMVQVTTAVPAFSSDSFTLAVRFTSLNMFMKASTTALASSVLPPSISATSCSASSS